MAAFLKSRGCDDVSLWEDKHNALIKLALSATRETRWIPNIILKDRDIKDHGFERELITDSSIIFEKLNDMNFRLQKFNSRLNEIESGLNSFQEKDSKRYERAIESLGKLFGFLSKNYIGKQGAPDGLWVLSSGEGIVFEAKSNKEVKNPVTLKDVRKCATHAGWVKSNDEQFSSMRLITVLLTNQLTIMKDAHSISNDIFVVSLDDLVKLFEKYKSMILELHSAFKRERIEVIYEEIQNSMKDSGFSHQKIIYFFKNNKLKDLKIK